MTEPTATAEPVTIVDTPIKLDYSYTPGVASSRFLRSLERGEIVGQRCPRCAKVYVPPRGACSMCGVATDEELVLSGKGTITTFCVTRVPSPGLTPPYVSAWILLDGADTSLLGAVDAGDAAAMRTGMRVRARWADERVGSIRDLVCFEPAT